ncbi:hypothetical protein KP509_06G070000 [Ceratopteris richardii]|uniref:B box-type domain-containing protein n=1 Tax=Ceratopteris richardii TaxID=49495 RepID=A0A8T2UP66_CERRI|nr:hypothetical protein KP509_06G070000 [Ceratopteris richardii]
MDGFETCLDTSCSPPQRWLSALLAEKFFVPCSRHDSSSNRRNERNCFCLDCGCGICQHCVPTHNSHRLLQIRRYVYHDVVRLSDIQKLFDCSQVQAYVINSAKVVFLNERPQPKATKQLSNTCKSCQRNLQDSYRYCSVACKVDASPYNVRERLAKASDSRSSSGILVSEELNHTEEVAIDGISPCDLRCGEYCERSAASSECSSAAEYGCSDRCDSSYSPYLLYNNTIPPTISTSNQQSIICRLKERPGANGAFSFKVAKHLKRIRYQSTSCSIFTPTSLKRRKRKPQRSPLL